MTMEPSKDVKDILKAYCQAQRDKHGHNWKEIKAKEISDQVAPTAEALFNALKGLGDDKRT